MEPQEAKKDFLDRIVFRWMKDDIEKMNQLALNFPLALCTLSYMGFLGSILLGKDKFNGYEDGAEYINKCFDDKVKSEYPTDVLRDVFRNPLAHEYFARGGISKEGKRPAILKGSDGKMILDAKTLAGDFLVSLNKFRDILENDTDGKFESRLNEMRGRTEEEENRHGYKFQFGYYASSSTSSLTIGVYPISAATELVSAWTAGAIDKTNKFEVMEQPKIVTISIPEYTIDTQPDYGAIGAKIDKAIVENFDGTFLVRALSIADHSQYTLDQLAEIILKSGTDKYDPNRKGVAHEEFEPYKPDLQAGEITIKDGKLVGESFSEDIRRFYENTLLDRGYRLRIDLVVLYGPDQMVQAEKVDHSKPSTEPHLEQYLWRFKDPENKPNAVAGILKILR